MFFNTNIIAKKIFLGILFGGLMFCLKAQDYYKQNSLSKQFNIVWGTELKDVTKSSCIGFLGEIDGNVYALKSDRQSITYFTRESLRIFPENISYYIDKLDSNMNVVYSTQVFLTRNGKKLKFERAIIFGKRLYIIGSDYVARQKRNFLYYQEYNLEDLSPKAEPSLIGELNIQSKSAELFVAFSPDSSKLLLLNDLQPAKLEKEHFSILVCNVDFNDIKTSQIALNYSERLFMVKEVLLDNEGNVFVLGKVYKDGSTEKKNGEPNYKYVLLQFEPGVSKPFEYSFALGKVLLHDLKIVQSEREIACVGFIYTKKDCVDGCFIGAVDKQSRSIAQYQIDFEGEPYKNLYERKVFLKPDGSFVLVAEQIDVKFKNGVPIEFEGLLGMVLNAESYVFMYTDIFVFSFSTNKVLERTSQIPKKQLTVSDSGFYSSFYVMPLHDELLFFYNDCAKNFGNQGQVDAFNASLNESMAVCASVDEDGIISKKYLFFSKFEQTLFRPKSFTITPRGEILIYATQNNYVRYGRLKIQD